MKPDGHVTLHDPEDATCWVRAAFGSKKIAVHGTIHFVSDQYPPDSAPGLAIILRWRSVKGR